MAESRGRFVWGIASSVMALAVNLHRDPKRGQPARPSDFNPFTPKAQKPILRGKDLKEALVAAFVGKKNATP